MTRPFLLPVTPVTQGKCQAVTGKNPSRFHEADRPVTYVSWLEAIAYCNALSCAEGLEEAYAVAGSEVRWKGLDPPYHPTDAEWEYACRAGTTGARYGNLDEVAWHSGNSGGQIHPVRQRAAQRLGLYDKLGNVWEWWWDRSGSIPRGGSRIRWVPI